MKSNGFTLIELSIVLVIIGLIVGGVLVGRDLVNAAAMRAQISQIEKYNTAANTFREKYGYLPGDMPAAPAAQFGFVTRGASTDSMYAAEGNGDGILRGAWFPNYACGACGAGGEVLVFWVDLSTAHLIDGNFNSASETADAPANTTNIGLYLPQAKIGGGNYVTVWSGGTNQNISGTGDTGNNAINYFSVSIVNKINLATNLTTPGLTMAQAYSIDKKMDDGLPQFGSVTAAYVNGTLVGETGIWAATSSPSGLPIGSPWTNAWPASATKCFDNGGVVGKQQYSVTQDNGNDVNCALSFQFQ